MSCNHITMTGFKCNNPVLKNSTFCYLKSHHISIVKYKKAIAEEKLDWIRETYPVDFFFKHNTPNDGWCFYYSFGLAILEKFKNKTNNNNINSFFNQEDFKVYIDKKDWENKQFKKQITIKVYLVSRKWLKENVNNVHDETKEQISDFIVDMNNFDTLDEYFSDESFKVDINENLPEKYWGGVCEQYSLSKYFETDVIVFKITRHSFSKDEKKYKTMNSKVVRKDTTRYKLLSGCFGNTSCEKSTVLQVLQSLSERKNNIEYFFNLLPDETRKKTIKDLNNTIFLLLFILNKSDNNISHYNYLAFKENIIYNLED